MSNHNLKILVIETFKLATNLRGWVVKSDRIVLKGVEIPFPKEMMETLTLYSYHFYRHEHADAITHHRELRKQFGKIEELALKVQDAIKD